MKIEVRDEKTIVITAESVPEHVLLKQFDGAVAKPEDPRPFAVYVNAIVLEAKGEPKK